MTWPPSPRDLGYVDEAGDALPPFRWNEDRRLRLRAKLDALYFHLYGVTDRDDIRYIYSTFPIVEREEQKTWGRYRSRELCLALDKRARRRQARRPDRPLRLSASAAGEQAAHNDRPQEAPMPAELAQWITPAIVVAAMALLLRGMSRLEDRLGARIDETNKRIDETNKRIDETNKRIDETNKSINETNKSLGAAHRRDRTPDCGAVEHGQARLEGLLEGLREAVAGRRPAA